MNPLDKQEPSGLLVTGDRGFVGRHALARWPSAVGLSVLIEGADIRNKTDLIAGLEKCQPNTVLHLAAQSFVPDSFQSPEHTFEVNVLGTLRLLEALKETGFTGRFLFVGTGDAYGLVPVESQPIREDALLHPRNPYAASKVAAEALCYQWSQTGPFEVTMVRPFNHIGAGQAPTFSISDFARQIAAISMGRSEPVLNVGNIDVTRDFTDINDVLRAYELLLTQSHNGEVYNVCSGVERSMRDLIQRLLIIAGTDAEIKTDPSRARPAEQPRVCGSHDKLSAHTGWQPLVPIDQTLEDIYRFWEKNIA